MNLLNSILKSKKKSLIIIISLVFTSLFLLFPAGSLNPSSTIENTADYLANVTANYTINGTYTAMVVEPNEYTDKKINNPYNEFLYLYGIFREGLATYIGSVNAEKSYSIKIKELEDETNFSFLSADSGFSVKEYYIDDDGNMVYVHEFYPLELMFYSNHPHIPGALSFIYLPQNKADILLDKAGLEHTRENYKSLLNTIITLDIDGKEYKYAIDNIYLQHHYFYSAVDEVMGDFLMGGAYYPSGVCKKQALFFLRNYSYQNKFYIEYATSIYPTSDFNYIILNRNFKNGFSIDNNKLIYSTGFNGTWSILLLAFSIFLLILSLLLILFGSFERKMSNHLLLACSLFLPYVIFWIIYAFAKNLIWFSSFSTISTIWCSISFIVLYLIILLAKYYSSKKKNNL